MKISYAKPAVIVLTAIGLLFVAAQAVFLILPTYRDIQQLGVRITQAQGEVQAQYDNRKNLLATASDIRDAQKTIDALGVQFIGQGDELAFITQLEALADKNGVSLRKQLSAGSGDYPEYNRSVSVQLDGPYRAVLKALVDIERTPYLVSISNIAIQGNGGATPDQTIVAVSLTGTAASPPKSL